MKKLFLVAVAAIFTFTILPIDTSDARNRRALIQTKKGKANSAWVRRGVRKFIRAYAGKFRHRIVSGSESAWRKYPNKQDVKVTKVTYNINGFKRNVAYVWAYTNGSSVLSVVANASSRQQSVDRDIARLLRRVK
ncbi:hypothetical protein [uncultured Tateyamaria sp.]|uniref:hypothetical protein n=1 Tax=uncultured Tateyamaria sp. TaxID=455651 RepID=UPI002623FEFA|nr:hypothetical protein [uncultured Tateyamaria sp.]